MSKRTRASKSVEPSDSVRRFQSLLDEAGETRYQLVLYIAGTTPQSVAALETLVAVCAERIPGRYQLAVVDVYQEPARAKEDQVIAVPTLVKRQPPPLRRLIGDLSDRQQLLRGLGLPPDVEAPNAK